MIVNTQYCANSIHESSLGDVGVEGVNAHCESQSELDRIGKWDSDLTIWLPCDSEEDSVVLIEELVAAAYSYIDWGVVGSKGNRSDDYSIDLYFDHVGEGVVDLEHGPVAVVAPGDLLLKLDGHVVGRVGGHVVHLV